MPDAAGNIKGIALTGKAGEAWDRIFGDRDEERHADDCEVITQQSCACDCGEDARILYGIEP